MKNASRITQLFVFVLISTSILAQENNFEYGKITQQEFDLKNYEKDKNAEAVVLFDIGKSYFVETEIGFKVVYERKTRIKILSNAGTKWGEIQIPYYQQGNIFEEIMDLQGTTYNPDEAIYVRKSTLDTKNSFDEKINNNWKSKKFAMPDVKANSIIEYQYKIYSDYMFNLRDWEFQWEIPVVYSKYSVSMIPFYEYAWLFQGDKNFDEKRTYTDNRDQHFGGITYQNNIHEFVMKDVPAFNDEEFITSKNDFISKIDFQLAKVNQIGGSYTNVISTWEAMNKELLESKSFGDYISKSEKMGLKNLEVQKIASSISVEEKFNYVIDYVKNNYKWNGQNDKFASKTPSEFEKQKTGNSADINLYTIGLLRSVGISAKPIVVSTRNHGRVKFDYPYLHFFNYVTIFVELNGKKTVSDATEIMSINNRVPERCINNKGLIVEKNKAEWLNMETLATSDNITNISVNINKDNSIEANITKIGTEYEALRYKNKFGDDKDKIKDHFKSQIYEINDTTIKFANLKKTNKSYAFTFETKSNPEIINGKMYINPFFGLNLSENPLKKTDRTFPIDMIYPKRTTFTVNIKIPSEWQINYLPENKKIENELFSIEYDAVKNEDNIDVSFSYYFKKSVYSSNHYILLKSYFNDIVNKGNDKIVLLKK